MNDMFTALGAPWAHFFQQIRRRARLSRVGDLVTCSCGKTFMRTDPDPQALQVCQVCDHDSREGYVSVPVAAPPRVGVVRRMRRGVA